MHIMHVFGVGLETVTQLHTHKQKFPRNSAQIISICQLVTHLLAPQCGREMCGSLGLLGSR